MSWWDWNAEEQRAERVNAAAGARSHVWIEALAVEFSLPPEIVQEEVNAYVFADESRVREIAERLQRRG